MKRTLASVKTELAAHLQRLLDSEQPISMTWACPHCREQHSGNLLKKVKSIAVDHQVEEQQADLAFFDDENQLFAALHFVKRKSADPALIEFYQDKCIALQIRLEPGDDLNSVVDKLHAPLFVSACFNPKCKKCGGYMEKIILWIVDGECWKCNQPIKVAAIEAGMSRGGTYVGPEDFMPKEIETAREKGVIIAEQYSKTRQEKYLANTCPHCNNFVGSHFLFTEYISNAGYGYYPYETLTLGYFCEACTDSSV